jgi:hypothetical protein
MFQMEARMCVGFYVKYYLCLSNFISNWNVSASLNKMPSYCITFYEYLLVFPELFHMHR